MPQTLLVDLKQGGGASGPVGGSETGGRGNCYSVAVVVRRSGESGDDFCFFFVRGQSIEEDSSESRTWENHYPLLVGRADVIAVNDVINPSLIHHPAKSSPLAGVI